MLQIGAFEAKNTFGSLLDRVEAGRGDSHYAPTAKPAARLAPTPHCNGCGPLRVPTPPWSG